MPLSFKNQTSSKATAGAKPTTSTSAVAPKGMASILKMEPGTAFMFESARKAHNNAPFIKMKSKDNPGLAVNLTTFKPVHFDAGDFGTPIEIEIVSK